jgi:hypothetical protein
MLSLDRISLSKCLIGGRVYQVNVDWSLPELLEDVCLCTRQDMYQHDKAPAHYKHYIHKFWMPNFQQSWSGMVDWSWPLQSPDLIHSDFFSLTHSKENVYQIPAVSLKKTVDCVHAQVALVNYMVWWVNSHWFNKTVCDPAGQGTFEQLQ